MIVQTLGFELILGICQNGLDRIDLRLVLLESHFDWIDGESRCNPRTGIYGTVGKVLKHRESDNPEGIELIGYRLDTLGKGIHVDRLGFGFNIVQTFGGASEVKGLLQLLKSVYRCVRVLLEYSVVEHHLYNSVVNSRHPAVTSFQTSSAICSKIFDSAGLM